MSMTPDEQRIAIAEACGWTNTPRYDSGKLCWYKKGELVATRSSHLPDYLSDLNAIHEAEKALTEEQCFIYNDHLCEIVDGGSQIEGWLWRATAAQRAEAFLRVIQGA